MEPIGECMVRAEDGVEYDVLVAIESLPWVSQLCPLMPHQYVVRAKAPDWAWNALEASLEPDELPHWTQSGQHAQGMGQDKRGELSFAPKSDDTEHEVGQMSGGC
jgi:hypothetical protein